MLAYIERLYGAPQRARVIANGRSPARWAPAEKEPFVLSAGRLWDEAKNVAALERIAPRVPWPIHVAGEANRRAAQGLRSAPRDAVVTAMSAAVAEMYGRDLPARLP